MAINEWKVWQKFGAKKPEEPKVDIDKDVDAILSSVKDAVSAAKKISVLTGKFKMLRSKEKKLKDDIAKRSVIEEQVKVYDQILKEYEFYELDVDINGERVKNISHALGKKAKEAHISKKWLDKINKSERWTFNW